MSVLKQISMYANEVIERQSTNDEIVWVKECRIKFNAHLKNFALYIHANLKKEINDLDLKKEILQKKMTVLRKRIDKM